MRKKFEWTKKKAWIVYIVMIIVYCIASPIYLFLQYIWSISTSWSIINVVRIVLSSLGVGMFMAWLVYMSDREMYIALTS